MTEIMERTEQFEKEVFEMEKEENEIYEERYQLVLERIRQIPEEMQKGQEAWMDYFKQMAAFLLLIHDTRNFLVHGGLETASMEELARRNQLLYEDILPQNYENSYGNPAYAVKKLDAYGQLLSFLYRELRQLISSVYEMHLDEMVVRMELFVEIYGAFLYEWQENQKLPAKEEIKKILYWFSSDYTDLFTEHYIESFVGTENSFAANLVRTADVSELRYLYAYGEYVSENELETAKYMAGLPEETVRTMANTYTEGYRIGFEVGGMDLSKKSTVGVYYKLGFERMIQCAFENFEKMGLKPASFRGNLRSGFSGGCPNRQYEYDHKDDLALLLDKNLVTRKLEVRRAAFEKRKTLARGYAGPAVVETFGERDFNPVNKAEAIHMTEETNKLWIELRSQLMTIQREYIPEEERSFTIIAFPVPEIGPVFEELFHETIRINTLDYMLYRNVQQKLIDALDTADYCEVIGSGENRTRLKVNLWKLKDPEKETIFENCVADVNIPVGEVFTSPVLEGTNGVLHVSKVFLNGLEYRNLAITFQDGMIVDYTCENFEEEEACKAFVKENILFRQETLPIGEFAIGTNTTAYVVSRRLGVESKLPILIAEKTGPHFAVGDTCYSHSEERKVYNPDGKEIVAKDNSKSLLRDTNPGEAYFNCHTDITIPYDELEELTAVRKDGTRIEIIRNGRFVLPGTEPLNEAFGE